jgi:uncharacterized YccA/Bax inhibitor family protein
MNTSSSNPALRGSPFLQLRGTTSDTMTMNGVVWKSGILWALLTAAAIFTWSQATSGSAAGPWIMVGALGGLVLSIVISFKPTTAPMLAPVFALAEGLALGGISAYFEAGYPGIVGQAVLGTCGVFVAMLVLYRTGVIRVTSMFRRVITTAMFGIFITYLASFVLSLFHVGIPFIFDSGPIGIGFSLVVIFVASMMLAVDFDMIERGAAQGAPKFMEWYGAFALMVTLIWIYMELLRLLAKLRD